MGMTSKHQEYCTLQPTFILAIGPSFGVSSWREEKIACKKPVEERLTQPAIPKPRKANCDLKIKQLEDVRKMGFCQGNGHEIIGFMAGGHFFGIGFFGKMWMMSTWLFPYKNFRTFPNGPEIGPAFSSCSMIILFFVLLKSWHLPHVYTHGGFFWHFISVGVYEKLRKPASWLVAVCERSENRGCGGGVVAERERNLAVPLCWARENGAFCWIMYH